MHGRSAASAISHMLACAGVASLIGAASLGTGSAFFEMLIVVGIDGLTIGVAGRILLLIFSSKKQPPSAVSMHRPPRSLESSEAYELKIMLVQHLARDKPVIIGFSRDDPEAERFARQIATYSINNSFRVVGFGAELPSVPLEPGVGVGDGNHVLIGPAKPVVAHPAQPSTVGSGPC